MLTHRLCCKELLLLFVLYMIVNALPYTVTFYGMRELHFISLAFRIVTSEHINCVQPN